VSAGGKVRDLDIVAYGASGFTGRQLAIWLDRHAPPGLRLGIAGRSAERLAAVAAGLGRPVVQVVADAGDAAALRALAARTRVIASTAGPFSRLGSPLVAACVAAGADYCDITGETPWVAELIARHHAVAADAGVRIVPFCGFDSVPSDLGAWSVARYLRAEWGQPTRSILAAFSAKGGFNGGTMATLLTLSGDPQAARAMADRHLLDPPGPRPARTPERLDVRWDPVLQRWLTPFFMAPYNTRVVRRTAAWLAAEGQGYGDGFVYDEAMETRAWAGAQAMRAGLAVGMLALKTAGGRRVAARWVPAPGTGPSEAAMDGGFFRTRLVGVAADGRMALGTVSFAGDPGNRATVAMLGSAALALAEDRDRLPPRAGVLTPALAFEGVLVERLRSIGFTWSVVPCAGS